MQERVSSLLVPNGFHHKKGKKSECFCCHGATALLTIFGPPSFKFSTHWDPSHGIPVKICAQALIDDTFSTGPSRRSLPKYMPSKGRAFVKWLMVFK